MTAKIWIKLVYEAGSKRGRVKGYFIITELQGVSKKRNLFDLEYLKDGFVKLIFLLVSYTVLPYNSVKPNFRFL